ncbi:hypothetical protein HMPREF0653_00306 [Prevotella disiens JCM 6334 = ATCC 29426]|uniref:Bacteriocin-type signal sequence n=1 Tax=Prevotella disiens JCM 6334 = ATCC 29426 TaxID=1235811 RepID=A0ABN0NV50_9BACT|nr:hypothetical protein HMPREF0653_00306 [Prevotella disiens JCM 6334 = ATCC 29426]
MTLENGVLDGGFATLTDSQLLKLKGGGSDSTSGNNCQCNGANNCQCGGNNCNCF